MINIQSTDISLNKTAEGSEAFVVSQAVEV